jgi:RNA polymerase sigma-70 factor (ECF subfamily)
MLDRRALIHYNTFLPSEEEPVLAMVERNTRDVVSPAYQRYSRMLYGFILGIVGNGADAEDIMQECFVRALTLCQPPSFTEEEALQYCRRWLFQVATNLCLDLLRRRKRHAWPFSQFDRPAAPDDEDAERGIEAAISASGASLQDQVAQSLLVADVCRRLAPDDVSVLLLFEHCGFTLHEVAAIVGCSTAAAAKKVARARKRFIERYDYLSREEERR